VPYRVVVDPSMCLGCGSCVRACAYGVLTVLDGEVAYAVKPDECRGCRDCVEACEQGAIEVIYLG